MANRIIITSDEELRKLIGIASAMDAEEKNLPIEAAADHAVNIARIAINHLTGKEKVPAWMFGLYDIAEKGIGNVIMLFGGGLK